MKLHQIDIDRLSVSTLNMRHGRKAPDIEDLLPTVREKGVLTPLIVRPSATPDMFEIIAGRRRYYAAQTVELASLPCIVVDALDDADALEISLIENLARLDPDPMSEYEAFAKLAAKGRSAADIAVLFGLDEARVNRRLALGNLLPAIRQAYRKGRIDEASLQALTLATKTQQRDWLALLNDPDQRAPVGRQLKNWLFGGQSIATSVALFELETYPGEIVTDLFGETAYFNDSEAFWTLQMQAVEAMRQHYLEASWSDVDIFDTGSAFHIWHYEKRSKAKGGHIIIDIAHTGEVTVHEGYLSQREIARQAKTENGDTAQPETPRRELTAKLENYCTLHRHNIVRGALLGAPQLALRLLAAHLLAGSELWSVRAEPQRAACGETAQSLKAASVTDIFERERAAVCELLGIPFDASPLVAGHARPENFAHLFVRLTQLDDQAVIRILTFAMAESLAAGGIGVELAGRHLAIDAAAHWQPDEAFFTLLRDKAAINAMLAETRSAEIAKANAGQTRNQQVEALKTGLAHRDAPWAPHYLTFPFATYTDKSGGLFDRLNAVVDAQTAPAETGETDSAPESTVESEAA